MYFYSRLAIILCYSNIIEFLKLYINYIYSGKNKFTYIEALENRLRNTGPSSKALCAVTGYVMEGTLFRLHNSYSERTRIRMQYVQRSPMIIVATKPTMYPAL